MSHKVWGCLWTSRTVNTLHPVEYMSKRSNLIWASISNAHRWSNENKPINMGACTPAHIHGNNNLSQWIVSLSQTRLTIQHIVNLPIPLCNLLSSVFVVTEWLDELPPIVPWSCSLNSDDPALRVEKTPRDEEVRKVKFHGYNTRTSSMSPLDTVKKRRTPNMVNNQENWRHCQVTLPSSLD